MFIATRFHVWGSFLLKLFSNRFFLEKDAKRMPKEMPKGSQKSIKNGAESENMSFTILLLFTMFWLHFACRQALKF